MSLVKKNPSNLNRIIKGTKYSEAFMGKPTDEQRVIIENANANNMVIAAPGSGKSFTMIEAVISILRQFPYAKVGMVTFTRAATN